MKNKLKCGFWMLLLGLILASGMEIIGSEPQNTGGIRSQRRQRRNRTETTTNTNRTNTNNSNRNNSNSGRSSNSGNNRRQSQQTTQPTQPAVQQSVQPAPTPSKPTSGYINGHEWVDLGLPSGLKWATCNVGASSPSDYGNYYAWGETTIKSSYTSDNCKTWEKNIGNIGGNISYDAARANWGSSWRMPTKAEFNELLNNCTLTYAFQGEHNGYKVTSKKNGNSIFLPAAGYKHTTFHIAGEFYCYYWSSTPQSSDTYEACNLYLDRNGCNTNWQSRSEGMTIRPVSD